MLIPRVTAKPISTNVRIMQMLLTAMMGLDVAWVVVVQRYVSTVLLGCEICVTFLGTCRA
jgi:hypothetical protein